MFAKPLLRGLLSQVRDTAFDMTWWDGSVERYGSGPPRFRLFLGDPGVVDLLWADVETGFAEAYINGRIEVEGDLADVVATALRHTAMERSWTGRRAASLAAGLTGRLPRRRSLRRQKDDIARHYDLGNDFFRLFLDNSMTYSCAYFRTPEDSLDQAQAQKVDYSLRKLRLQPGETLLDIGCGWGSVIQHAVRNYGVKALGITLSEEQAHAVREMLSRETLGGACAVSLANYLDLAKQGRRFDKIISIGMIEHVGYPHMSTFARAVRDMLAPGGMALLHSITRTWRAKDEDINGGFVQWVFPGGYIPALHELTYHFASNGLHILDMENLREHYRLTLDHWSERYERNVPTVEARFGERFARLWRLYLRGCSAGFREGMLQVHQVLVSNALPRDLPLTRSDLYA